MRPPLHLAALAAALAALAGCQPHPPPDQPARSTPPSPRTADAPLVTPPAPFEGKPLLMHYMPWYKTPKRGAWGSHWTGHERQHNPDVIKENGLPDIWSHYHPLIGLYDSTDPDVLLCQLLQMKFAGVDGVIPDWYGTAPHADYPEIHQATEALFAAVQRVGLHFAVCYEDRSVKLLLDWGKITPAEATNQLVRELAWLDTHWFNQPHYVRLDDRPLLLNFGPIHFTGPDAWQTAFAPLPVRPKFFALHHLWRQAGADGGFSWVHTDPWEGTPTPETIRTRIGEVFTYFTKNPAEAIVSAFPGFYDVYTHEVHPKLAHRDGATLRETLEVALAGPWPLVQLVTWNDYGEGTIIEPTHEFGYTFLEVIQTARRQERGDTFPFTPDDLRLPARWLALRQANLHPPAQLDQIADLMILGHTALAQAELTRLESLPAPTP